LLQVNFLKSDPTQIWTWSIYNWTTKLWIPIGDSVGVPVQKWNSLIFPISSVSNYISPVREVRVQLRSSNSGSNVKLDYEALHLTYVPITPTATSLIATALPTKPAMYLPTRTRLRSCPAWKQMLQNVTPSATNATGTASAHQMVNSEPRVR
jgi:hypothetical protein